MANDEASIVALNAFVQDPNVRFPRKPRLLEDLGVYPMPEGIGMQFRGAPNGVAFRGLGAGAIFDYLLQALDGTRELPALLAQCPDGIPPGALLSTIVLLHTRGLLREGDPTLAGRTPGPVVPADPTTRRQLLFWGRSLGLTGYLGSAEEAQGRLARARVVVLGTGGFGASTADLLGRSGCADLRLVDWDDDGFLIDALRHAPSPPRPAVHLATTSLDEPAGLLRAWAPEADLVVVATRNAPAALLRAVNRICLDCRCPVLFANDDGTGYRLGPYVLPYAAACYACVELREASAHPSMLEEHVYQRRLAEPAAAGETRPRGESLAAATLAASLVVLEVTRILTGVALPTLVNAVLTVSPLKGEMETHPVLRVPRCPDCSGGCTLPLADDAHGRATATT